MAFLLPALEGLGSGLLGSAIGGSLGSGIAGNAQNAAMNALNTQDENFQLGMYASEIQNQEQLQVQSEAFDQMMDERSENMREVDTLRNVDMAQRKMDALRTIATRGALLSVARRARLMPGSPPTPTCRQQDISGAIDVEPTMHSGISCEGGLAPQTTGDSRFSV
jgi:hypothetical protein